MGDNQSKKVHNANACFTQEIKGIIHPLPRYTCVCANINNMARDDLETIFCEDSCNIGPP